MGYISAVTHWVLADLWCFEIPSGLMFKKKKNNCIFDVVDVLYKESNCAVFRRRKKKKEKKEYGLKTCRNCVSVLVQQCQRAVFCLSVTSSLISWHREIKILSYVRNNTYAPLTALYCKTDDTITSLMTARENNQPRIRAWSTSDLSFDHVWIVHEVLVLQRKPLQVPV